MCPEIHPRRRGFALIEVMAIVAVLGFVVVVGVSVFIQQRESNNRSSCQQKLKNLSQAFLQYAADYDGRMPPINGVARVGDEKDFNGCPLSNPRYGWADNLASYLNGYAYQCLMANAPVHSWCDANPTQRDYTTYYYNSNLNRANVFLVGKAYNPKAIEPPIGARKVKVVCPGRSILFGEGIPGDARYNRTATEHRGQPPADERHLGGGNYAFCDGHVKWLKREQIFNGVQTATEDTTGSPTNLAGYAATHLVR